MVSRFATAVLLAIVLYQTVGVSLAAQRPCPEQCEDDGPDGACAPTCEDCLCCAHARATLLAPASVALPGEGVAVRSRTTEAIPLQAELDDILRVPKSAR